MKVPGMDFFSTFVVVPLVMLYESILGGGGGGGHDPKLVQIINHESETANGCITMIDPYAHKFLL